MWDGGAAASFLLNLEIDGSEYNIQLHSLAPLASDERATTAPRL